MKSNNKTIKYILGGLFLTGFMAANTACDPLGIEPTTKVDEEHFWENAHLARSYVNNLYFIGESFAGQHFQSEQWSDNCQGNYESDWNTYRQYSFNYRQYDFETGSTVSGPWSGAYQNIRKINIGLERIASSSQLMEDEKNQMLGECHFFRAFVYFDMEKYWGAVPYVDKTLTIEDETFLPQATREELFDNIIADLQTSAEYFTKFGKKGDIGMVNGDVANAYLSRVALYAANAAEASAKGLHNSDLFKFSKAASHYYNIAWEAAQKVIGKYSLEPNYEDLFTSQTAHTSAESIWPVMFKNGYRSGFNPTGVNGPDGTLYGGTEEASYSWDFRSGLFPTQDLVDAYLQKDEATGEWKNWWETSQSKAMGVTRNAEGEFTATSADYRKMYENRDARFYATVTYDGSYLAPADKQAEMYLVQTWIDNSDPKQEESFKYSALHTGYRTTVKMEAPGARASAQTITGYYSRKYSQYNMWNENGTLNWEQRQTCYFNIRYAEVLLNAAEASIKLGKGQEASYINQIRNRAGIGNYTGSNWMEELKVQRRLEFAFECPGHRYFDLLRWSESEGKSTIDELNRPSRGIWIFRKGVESMKIGENGYPVQPGDEGYFTPYFETTIMDYQNYFRKFNHARFYFLPFGGTLLNSYPQIKQNPGWDNYKYND